MTRRPAGRRGGASIAATARSRPSTGPRPGWLLVAIAVAIVVSACSAAGASVAPSSAGPFGSGGSVPPPSRSASPTATTVATPEAAMAAVVATEPRFSSIQPKDPNLIGQSAWYEAKATTGATAFVVTIEVGWGDCPAGCIDRHRWTYGVAADGTVDLRSEQGPAVPPSALPTVVLPSVRPSASSGD